MKVFENELSLNRLDQYNCRNNIELQGIPLNIDDETLEDKVVNIFESLNTNTKKNNTKNVIDLRKLTQKTKLFNLWGGSMLKKHYRKKNLNKIDDVNLNFELNVDPFQSATCMEMSWKKTRVEKIHSRDLLVHFLLFI